MSGIVRWLIGCSLLGGIVAAWGGWTLWPLLRQLGDPHRPRSFYVPTESMLPTLAVGDRIRPLLVGSVAFRRGMVIVFRGPEGVHIDRIAGLSGDEVAIRQGHLSVNGHPATERDAGPGPVLDGGVPTRVQLERLPGEVGQHRLLDAGISAGDDYGPVRVPLGALFMLGDNRDRAADSRVGPEIGGLGFVSASAVVGIVDRQLWGHSRRDLGRPLD